MDQWLVTIARDETQPSEIRSTAMRRIGETMPIADLGKLYDGATTQRFRSEIINVLGKRKEDAAADKLIDIVKNGTDPSLRTRGNPRNYGQAGPTRDAALAGDHQQMTTLMRATAGLALLVTVAGSVSAQTLERRVSGAPDGNVTFHFASRADVCGDGRTYIRADDMWMGSFNDGVRSMECERGPIRVLLTRDGKEILRIDDLRWSGGRGAGRDEPGRGPGRRGVGVVVRHRGSHRRPAGA